MRPLRRCLRLWMDNCGTHKTPEVQRWFKRHPRFVTHLIPTGTVMACGSWFL